MFEGVCMFFAQIKQYKTAFFSENLMFCDFLMYFKIRHHHDMASSIINSQELPFGAFSLSQLFRGDSSSFNDFMQIWGVSCDTGWPKLWKPPDTWHLTILYGEIMGLDHPLVHWIPGLVGLHQQLAFPDAFRDAFRELGQGESGGRGFFEWESSDVWFF